MSRRGEYRVRVRTYLLWAAVLVLFAQSAAAAGIALRDSLTAVARATPAAPLVLARLDGETYTLEQRRGHVVLVNFWATWCPPCRAEMPAMERIWQRLHARGLDVVGVNVGESAEAIRAFLKQFGTSIGFPILLDAETKAMESWGVRGLPASFVVDKRGRVRYTALGGRRMDSGPIVGLIDGLLAE